MQEALSALPPVGRVALVDLVRCPSHEARLAFPSLVSDVVRRVGGRLAWAGSIDQQLVGAGLEGFHDVLVSELPTAEACLRALAERRAWQPERFVTELATWTARPWSGWRRLALAAGFRALRLTGRGPKPLRGEPTEAWLDALPHGDVDPTRDQMRALLAAPRDGRVTMVNFLRYRRTAGDASEGAAEYAAYGRRAASLIARLGGRIRYSARGLRVLAGDPEAPWDDWVVVEYPSRAAFLGMIDDPRYRAVSPGRATGLDSTRLLACTAHAAFH